MAKGLHISVAPEPIAHIGDFEITNSLFTSFLVMIILLLLAVKAESIAPDEKKPKGKETAVSPGTIPVMIDLIIEKFYLFFQNILGKDKVKKYFPLIFTFFLFIILIDFFYFTG